MDNSTTPTNTPIIQRGAIFQSEESYQRWLDFHKKENPSFDPSTYHIEITNNTK